MPGEKQHDYEHIPIPSYDEATSSRTPTPSLRRPNEAGDEQEREGLISAYGAGGRPPPRPTRRAGYRPPAVAAEEEEEEHHGRDSLDAVDLLAEGEEGRESGDSEEEEVRREMEQMEVLDPPVEQSSWGKRISSISQSLRWPFNFTLPDQIWKWICLKFTVLNGHAFMLIGRFIALLLVLGVVYLLFMSDFFTNTAQKLAGQSYDPERVRLWVGEQVSGMNIRDNLRHVTLYDHVAGSEGDFVLAKWVEERFRLWGLEGVQSQQYTVYLNYPKAGGRAVEILNIDGSVRWEAQLEEDNAYPDEPRQQTPVFHGHSKSGSVTGPLIYASGGSREDFKRLYDSGIETNGAIALVRYYGSQGDRALKVKAAELAGFAGCLIYSDPSDNGFLKGDTWPNGRYLPSDGVQRGSVSYMSWVVGDVLTPGWASNPGAERISKDGNPGLPSIPSLPLSWRDAQVLLQAIQGFGQPCPPEWHGGVPDVDWWTGNLSSPLVHLKNEQDEIDEQPIFNVMGQIRGVEQPEKTIIVGNHRDAWTFGASDPGSGTAVMLEVIRVLGNLKGLGWRPRRTIQFASWSGEEYNLIGSTEYVEDNMEALRRDGFAYLNVDVAVAGQDFHAAASPVFQKVLLRVLNRISNTAHNATLREVWESKGSKLEGLGAGSDYVAFQDMAGISSLDFGFTGQEYPYHSVYDNFEWMDQFGDPGFQYHHMLGQIWALLILELSDSPILPFEMTAYSAAVTQYAMELERWAESKGANQNGKPTWSIEPLRAAVLQFQRDAQQFSTFETEWETTVYGARGDESAALAAHRNSHNIRMANFETNLLDVAEGGGIPGRSQFKHIIFGPQLWSGYDEAFFPAIRDAVEAGDWALAQQQVEKAASILSRASHKLVGN